MYETQTYVTYIYIEKCYEQKQDSYLHSYRTSNFALNVFQILQFSFTVLIVY